MARAGATDTHRPRGLHAEPRALGDCGELIDRARSYTAVRSASTQGDRFLLNGRPYFLRMVLDQGYWQVPA
jgi:hypothetical protein